MTKEEIYKELDRKFIVEENYSKMLESLQQELKDIIKKVEEYQQIEELCFSKAYRKLRIIITTIFAFAIPAIFTHFDLNIIAMILRLGCFALILIDCKRISVANQEIDRLYEENSSIVVNQEQIKLKKERAKKIEEELNKLKEEEKELVEKLNYFDYSAKQESEFQKYEPIPIELEDDILTRDLASEIHEEKSKIQRVKRIRL